MTEDLPPQSLEGRVAALEVLVQDLGEAVAQEVDDIKAAVLELADGAPADRTRDGGEVPPVLPLAARATAKDWSELAGWIDWLAATYDLPPCPAVRAAHAGVVHEHAALRTAWVAAATTDAAINPATRGSSGTNDTYGLPSPSLTRITGSNSALIVTKLIGQLA